MVDSALSREIEVASRLAREAGRIILEHYEGGYQVVEKPDGGGPVTVADQRANDHVVKGLREAFPGDGIVAEETSDTSDSTRYDRCWFIDPLDGTREFIRHNGEFAVHVGLAIAGKAVAGVVYRPVGDKLYRGVVGSGCFLETTEGVRSLLLGEVEPGAMRLLASRSHRTRASATVQAELGITEVVAMGSVGVKCGALVEGAGDLYVHASRVSSRWDICAPEAIVRAAGGILTDLAGEAYRYDCEELQNSRGILACGSALFPTVLPVISRVARERGLIA